MYCGFFWFGFFFPLKICTSQMMGIGLCSPHGCSLGLAAHWPCAVVAAEPCVLLSQCQEHMWCPFMVEKGTLGPKGGGQCQQHVAQRVTVPRGRQGVLSHSHSLISLCCCRELHPVLGQSSASCWHEGCHCFSGDGWAVHCLSLCLI